MPPSLREITVCSSQASATWVSCTSKVLTWHHVPESCGPCALSADTNGKLWLLQALPVYLCHAAAPLRSVKTFLHKFSPLFGDPLSISLTATISPPLLTIMPLIVRGHKHLCATHGQLQERLPWSDNLVSKSNRAILASAQHCHMWSHIRHFVPQINPVKSIQGTGQERLYKGEQTAGSKSLPQLQSYTKLECKHGAKLSSTVRTAIKTWLNNGLQKCTSHCHFAIAVHRDISSTTVGAWREESGGRGEVLREFGLFSLKRRRLRGDFIAAWKEVVVSVGIFSQVASNSTSGSGLRLHERRFRSDIRKIFFAERVVGHWIWLPREVVELPSLEVIARSTDMILKVFSNLQNPMIPWFSSRQ